MDAPSGDHVKQLARKLYWAVSSSIPNLSKQQRSSTFDWAKRMAERIVDDCHPSLPPPVDARSANGYTGQAEGRGGGRNRSSIQRSSRPPPPPEMPAWELAQAAMRGRAWAHVLKGRSEGDQLPFPPEVYREVGNGRSNSSG